MKTKKLIIATATLLAAVGMTSGTAITQAGLGVDQASAKSVRHTATPKSYKKLAKKAVHVSKGNLYSSAKLSKITHKAKNYKHTTFYRTKQAKVVKANKKTAVYNYIKSKNGKTKGWIWHGYVNNGKAPKAKTSKAVAMSAKSKSSSSVSSSNKISKNKLKSLSSSVNNSSKTLNNWLINPGKKTSGALTNSKGYLKPAKGTKFEDLGGQAIVGTLSNGHRMMGSLKHPSKYLEVMPGMHSNSEEFINNSGHWVVYYISGNGDDGIAAAPHKGFKYLSGMDQGLITGFNGMWMGNKASDDSTLYNWNSKILLINKKAAAADYQ
ncbi:hypothetical protein [Levilactobacillus yonginensis]|uniref:hypothetical protein n=1 Tax=Levilactobacillus yonginensis TaxID=1054041 RepID=UPI000F76A056|nr:hypothetical protein [Levilactobacillus yonginensis]